jgi:putative hydrolase of the HAD superfamily
LRELRAAGRRVVVVSNWDFSLHDVLGRIGLAPLLDGIVTSAECGARKPAREIFERALRLAGAEAAEAIHVGDSLAEDVEGARAAGVMPVLLRRDGASGPRGVTTIRSLTELPARDPWRGEH